MDTTHWDFDINFQFPPRRGADENPVSALSRRESALPHTVHPNSAAPPTAPLCPTPRFRPSAGPCPTEAKGVPTPGSFKLDLCSLPFSLKSPAARCHGCPSLGGLPAKPLPSVLFPAHVCLFWTGLPALPQGPCLTPHGRKGAVFPPPSELEAENCFPHLAGTKRQLSTSHLTPCCPLR